MGLKKTISFGQSDKCNFGNTHKLSSAKGSRLFAGDRKSIVRMLIIALFSVGTIVAVLFAYQQSTKPTVPHLISKDEAVQMARSDTKWDELMIDNYRIESTLVHVKENGYAFIVDKNTLQDTLQIVDKMQPDKYYNDYIWKIKFVSEESNRNEGYEWESWINAETGEIILSAINGSVISEQ